MTTPSPYEIASAIAAVVSAVGGSAAAIAAFRSAASAKQAATSAEDGERRATLREVSSAATAISLEVMNLRSRAAELEVEYQSARLFSGSVAHSGIDKLRTSTAELVECVSPLASNAELFAGGAKSLKQATAEEIDRLLIRLSEDLAKVRANRQELDRKYDAVRAENSNLRVSLLAAKYAR